MKKCWPLMKEKILDEVVVCPTGPVGEVVGLIVTKERSFGARGLMPMAALPRELALWPNIGLLPNLACH
jgi:hypothetical protein